MILAVKPVGTVNEYLAASAPLKVWVEVTAMAVPAFEVAKVPEFETVTTSAPTIPFKVAPEMVAVVVLSYTLESAAAPVIVSAFGAMV